MNTSISRIHGRQVLDSRGRPTVEVDVLLEDGSEGRASVPSGASTGRHEAHELRDGDPGDYSGQGVLQAVANVNGELRQHLCGSDGGDQAGLDRAIRTLDGTTNLARLGANAVLATSLAVARAASFSYGLPLYRYIARLTKGGNSPSLPMPMVNILSGGAHAGRGMDLQDFLMVPVSAPSYHEALKMIEKVRAAAAELLREAGGTSLLADEGGLSPRFARVDQSLDLMLRAFEAAGLKPGVDAAIALDVAASELREGDIYRMAGEGRDLSSNAMVELMASIVRRYPVVSIEDALDQDDWTGWDAITRALPAIQLVGDDLFATNLSRLEEGLAKGVANAALIKVNQNGSLSGTLDVLNKATEAGYATVVSARSGETEDAFIADLAVGTGAGQIKIGSVRNSERLAKYNQLLRIAEDDSLPFAGMSGFAGSDVGGLSRNERPVPVGAD